MLATESEPAGPTGSDSESAVPSQDRFARDTPWNLPLKCRPLLLMFFGCILDEDCRTTFVSELYSQDPAELQNVWIVATLKQKQKIIKIGSRLKFSEIEPWCQ